ncbi:DEAD/DEAH box helicase [Georgenia sp. TF02-10]|uniref:DEAD/DEAH box helicase n=1 Tax=Georgenia sp. TF02-10 TaxID=2917725 RepID=UPI001FA6B96F|nr:DEAD/DEAH box helicase [Georgenia sp. TF02-10]UNX54162.1 DEAD/DEAH box helicase [Georgenia sp. TF02-10]
MTQTTGVLNAAPAAVVVDDHDQPTPDITDAAAPADLAHKSFADFGVSEPIVEALRAVGITHPFPIQALTLPVALARHDIIGQAKTGTGKTLGFGIPLLQHLVAPGEDGWDTLPDAGLPQALVVVPTRELAKQVAEDLAAAARTRSVRILQVYGGRAYEPQIEALRDGVEVVVGTPGRLIDLLKQRVLSLSRVRTVVLDEADEMLDLGFLPDVETLLARTPAARHTMLFSATMPGAVVALARRYMTRPTHIRAQDPEDTGATVRLTRQVAYRAHALNKVEVLARILQARGRGLTIVFTRTKRTAAKVADELAERGFASAALHGDLGQGAREQALRAFRAGKVDVLVATDVAARGIDVDDVTHVINYQCPEDEKIYLHRIGRTGRAGNTGTAVTFVDWDDMPRWSLINKALDLGVPEPVETYHTSEHLYTDLDIPQGTTGRLPRGERTRAGLAAEAVEDLGETGHRHGGRGGGRDGQGGGRRTGTRGDGGRSGARGDGGRSGARGDGGRAEGGHDRGRDDGDRTGAPNGDRPRRRQRRRTRGGKPVQGNQGDQA